MTTGKTPENPLIILLVEDNLAHAELVSRSLEDHPLANKIFHVSDGEAALDYLARRGPYRLPTHSPRPHVILLDLRLPKIDGLEVLREIRSSPEINNIPVVVLTTSTADRDVAKAYEYHTNSYLIKPVDFDQFTNLMADFSFYWLGWNYYPWS
jgi:CheY-like chemotaxis protein